MLCMGLNIIMGVYFRANTNDDTIISGLRSSKSDDSPELVQLLSNCDIRRKEWSLLFEVLERLALLMVFVD